MLTVLGWLVVVVLGSVVLARAIVWDRWQIFANLDSAIEMLFLPAWVVLTAAGAGRRWWLAGAAALICAAQVDYVAPEILASSPIPAAVRAEPSFKLFDANVQLDNYSMAGYIAQLRAYHPDVLTIEESQPDDLWQFESAGVLKSLPIAAPFRAVGPTVSSSPAATRSDTSRFPPSTDWCTSSR